jgi:AmiR/NasT family two-component response regulator
MSVKLLIAEDEAVVRMNLKELLRNAGYEVIGEATNGQEAIEQARQLRPDLVIMDIEMPEVDGLAAAKAITAERVAPVLLLTAHHEKERVQAAREAGVIAFVNKPYGENDLVPAIEVALARAVDFRNLQHEVESLKEQIETRKRVERAKGILMRQLNINEAEAYRRLQKRSMNLRKSMREIADAILLTHEVEKDT